MELNIKNICAEMPNYGIYKDWQREGEILGIAIHHSETVNRATGASMGSALTFFNYHIKGRGLMHGAYHYVVAGSGEIEYALDEKITAYHAIFDDPSNSMGLEFGQHWNNHYLAICVAGWFSEHRTYRDEQGHVHLIPNNYTIPSEAQWESLVALIQQLRKKYNIRLENVRGHRELAGIHTTCPGHGFDLAELRANLRSLDEGKAKSEPSPTVPLEIKPGEHVLLLPDTDKYLDAAMVYIWKFQPDVSFSIDEARGRWQYVTVVGGQDSISESQLARLRSGGAALVQRISGDPAVVQTTLDELTKSGSRFLKETVTTSPTLLSERTYTVQPGDTLSFIANQMYGNTSQWRVIFEANRDQLVDPGRVHPGQILQIP